MTAGKWIAAAVIAVFATVAGNGPAWAEGGFRISLEKDVPIGSVTGQPAVTFSLYNGSAPEAPLVASQVFSFGKWSANIVSVPKFRVIRGKGKAPVSGGSVLRIRADFTNTDGIDKDMDLYLEIALNGVVKGQREQVKPLVWAMFAGEAVYADTVTIGSSGVPEHNHDYRYYTKIEADARYSLTGHNHDASYAPKNETYTKAEVDTKLGGYYTQAQVDALISAQAAQIAALQAKLAKFSVAGNDIYITSANLHIRSGSGSTNGAVNGLGNLIVGYNENSSDVRTGSHNLVIGKYHSYSSYGGMVAGYNNTISSRYASVSGGANNTAGGESASVSGGNSNIASGYSAAVSGGIYNAATGASASVSGGANNMASGDYASASGGANNTAIGANASISGGTGNTASGAYTAVTGGDNNTASGESSAVSGGYGNTASGMDSSVSGGYGNMATGLDASVSGGYSNTASGTDSSVSGGYSNEAGGNTASVSGGNSRSASNDDDWAAGGLLEDN